MQFCGNDLIFFFRLYLTIQFAVFLRIDHLFYILLGMFARGKRRFTVPPSMGYVTFCNILLIVFCSVLLGFSAVV